MTRNQAAAWAQKTMSSKADDTGLAKFCVFCGRRGWVCSLPERNAESRLVVAWEPRGKKDSPECVTVGGEYLLNPEAACPRCDKP